jgi:hypothetical protein
MGQAGGRNHYDILTIEIEVSALQLGAEGAFGVLTHEAAHVLDWARHGEISGHGDRFAVLASELGMTVKRNTAADVPAEHVAQARQVFAAAGMSAAEIIALAEREFLASYEHEVSLNDDLRREYSWVIRDLGELLKPWAELIADWRPWSEDDNLIGGGEP